MRVSSFPVLVSLLALLALVAVAGGCMTVHAKLPEDAVRAHVAQEDGIDLAAICSYEGRQYTEGAVTCMAEQRMSCGPAGRWVREGDCTGSSEGSASQSISLR